MTFLCFFGPRPRAPQDEIETTDTPEVMKEEEDWRTKTVKFTLAKIMDAKGHNPTGQRKSNPSGGTTSTANSSSTDTTTTLVKDETSSSSMEVLPLVSMPDYYHRLKGRTDNILYFPPCAESSRLSEMADEITAPKKYAMTFDERIATTMMQGISRAYDTAERKLSIRAATTTKVLGLLNTALRQIMLLHVVIPDDEETVESGGGGAATTTTTMDYTPIMTEYVDIVRNVRELGNTNDNNDTTLDTGTVAKSTELVSRAYRLIQMTPRITNETNTVIETLNTMLLDKITDDYDDNKTNENEADVDLVDYSAFLSNYIVIANEAEKARVRGDEVRGRELVVQAFKANKTLLAF